MAKLQKFMRSQVFTITVLKGAISSIPRWRFVRESEKTVTDLEDEGSDDEFTFVSCPKNLDHYYIFHGIFGYTSRIRLTKFHIINPGRNCVVLVVINCARRSSWAKRLFGVLSRNFQRSQHVG